MFKDKQFAVLGLGRFGQSVVNTLTEHGADVMACDQDPEIVQDFSKYATHVVQADLLSPDALDELGLGNFDVVIIAVGSDLEASILATIKAKEKGCQYVLVKADNYMQKYILEKLGADRVVLPEREMGEKIALNMLSSNIIDIINLSDEFSILEIKPIRKWHNVSIKNANVRAEYGINILALKRNKDVIISPKPNQVILENDIMVVVGANSDLQRLATII